jgi:hypothetical protein
MEPVNELKLVKLQTRLELAGDEIASLAVTEDEYRDLLAIVDALAAKLETLRKK